MQRPVPPRVHLLSQRLHVAGARPHVAPTGQRHICLQEREELASAGADKRQLGRLGARQERQAGPRTYTLLGH